MCSYSIGVFYAIRLFQNVYFYHFLSFQWLVGSCCLNQMCFLSRFVFSLCICTILHVCLICVKLSCEGLPMRWSRLNTSRRRLIQTDASLHSSAQSLHPVDFINWAIVSGSILQPTCCQRNDGSWLSRGLKSKGTRGWEGHGYF